MRAVGRDTEHRIRQVLNVRLQITNVYGTGSVKIWKTRRKMFLDIRMFLQLYKVQFSCACMAYIQDNR